MDPTLESWIPFTASTKINSPATRPMRRATRAKRRFSVMAAWKTGVGFSLSPGLRGPRPHADRRRIRRVPIASATPGRPPRIPDRGRTRDRKSTRLNSSHMSISYAVFCLKKKKVLWLDDDHTRTIAERAALEAVGVYVITASYEAQAIKRLGFFLNDTATTEIYTLSLHDALPTSRGRTACSATTVESRRTRRSSMRSTWPDARSEEHTSELQSHVNLVCRLLLEKKKTNSINTYSLIKKKNHKKK